VSCLVVFFPVVVRMCRDLVEFGGSLVRIIWHPGLPSVSYASRGSFRFAALCEANTRNSQ
jgi:hypothetical protein